MLTRCQWARCRPSCLQAKEYYSWYPRYTLAAWRIRPSLCVLFPVYVSRTVDLQQLYFKIFKIITLKTRNSIHSDTFEAIIDSFIYLESDNVAHIKRQKRTNKAFKVWQKSKPKSCLPFSEQLLGIWKRNFTHIGLLLVHTCTKRLSGIRHLRLHSYGIFAKQRRHFAHSKT